MPRQRHEPKWKGYLKSIAGVAAALAALAGVVGNVKTLADFTSNALGLAQEGSTSLRTCNDHGDFQGNCQGTFGAVAFREPFLITPIVTIAKQVPSPAVQDRFDFSVDTTSPRGFTVKMWRKDRQEGWAGHPDIRWRAVSRWWAFITREKPEG